MHNKSRLSVLSVAAWWALTGVAASALAVTNPNNQVIPLSSLSSGEQHELVLLYELLFNAETGSLILIDEPEISLHLAWQVNFLRDLQEVSKLTTSDVIIATHSPEIIHDRWDLTVGLKGPRQ